MRAPLARVRALQRDRASPTPLPSHRPATAAPACAPLVHAADARPRREVPARPESQRRPHANAAAHPRFGNAWPHAATARTADRGMSASVGSRLRGFEDLTQTRYSFAAAARDRRSLVASTTRGSRAPSTPRLAGCTRRPRQRRVDDPRRERAWTRRSTGSASFVCRSRAPASRSRAPGAGSSRTR